MIHDSTDEQHLDERLEVSPAFRDMIQQRITRLESDAAEDERAILHLRDDDHIRRQVTLVSAQRQEANRMRQFLARSRTRPARP